MVYTQFTNKYIKYVTASRHNFSYVICLHRTTIKCLFLQKIFKDLKPDILPP